MPVLSLEQLPDVLCILFSVEDRAHCPARGPDQRQQTGEAPRAYAVFVLAPLMYLMQPMLAMQPML